MTLKYNQHRSYPPYTRRRKNRHRCRRRFLTVRFLLPLILISGFFSFFFPGEVQQLLTYVNPELRLPPILMERQENTPGSTNFEVHFLNVGQGLSVLVRSDDHTLLYDGGNRESSSYVVSYLQKHGIYDLDYLIASHYDADHISGLIGVLYTCRVSTVLGPDYVHDSATYDSFLQAVKNDGLSVVHPKVGTEYPLGDASFTVLAPQEIDSDLVNNNSIAIRLVNGQNSFLLTGDAEAESEEAMCRLGQNLYSDVLCPGHHGSSSSTCSLFLAYTQPDYAVISVGADNEYGHPHRETLQRLEDAGVTVYRTDRQGTIVARSDGQNITWQFEVPPEAQ